MTRFGLIPTDSILDGLEALVWNAFVPAFTGFSVDPVGVEARFVLAGQIVVALVTMPNNGTSNDSVFTMTMPELSNAPGESWGLLSSFVNNGMRNSSPGLIVLPPASDIATLYTSSDQDGWKMMNGKSANFIFLYERA